MHYKRAPHKRRNEDAIIKISQESKKFRNRTITRNGYNDTDI